MGGGIDTNLYVKPLIKMMKCTIKLYKDEALNVFRYFYSRKPRIKQTEKEIIDERRL